MSHPRSHSHSRQDSGQSRLSQSSVIISSSRTPSPSASPISPTTSSGVLGSGSADGLSKRHSWSRGREERLLGDHTLGRGGVGGNAVGPGPGSGLHGLGLSSSGIGSGSSNTLGLESTALAQAHGRSKSDFGRTMDDPNSKSKSNPHLGGGSRQYLGQPNPPEAEEWDIGLGATYPDNSSTAEPSSSHHQRSTSAVPYPSYYFHQDDRDHPRPYFHQFDSEASLDRQSSNSGHDTPPEDDGDGVDAQRLTFAPPLPGSNHRRQPSRAYDEQGNPRVSGVGARVAGAVSRNPTIRNVSRSVSRSFRQASERVVNIIGSENDGRVRLDDQEDRDEMANGDFDPKAAENGEEYLGERQAVRPDPKPPEQGRLRGKTLGVFGPESRLRKAMDACLKYPLTEPLILVLIILNVVVLTIQASKTLNTPRRDDGYFTSWEDFVLFALFIIFTVEMFARIVVTGLIIDPDTSLRQVLFGPHGFLSDLSSRFHSAQGNLQRQVSRRAPTKSWKQTSVPTGPKPQSTSKRPILLSEAPFQKAVAKQKLLSTQGRPYLRHSWHRVDMMAIIAFWITFLLAISRVEATDDRHVYLFRALSILRAGRLLVITSGTTTILHSLKRAVPMLITVGFFLIFAFTIFSIIGVQSFQGSFRRQCVLTDPLNQSSTIDLGQQCGGHLSTSLDTAPYLDLDGDPALIKPKGFICPINQVCTTADSNPNGGSTSFDNVFAALVQVITIAVVNGWTPIMYSAMDSDFFSSCLYFIVAVIVLNFWFLNLLTAVVVNTFKDIRAETKKSAFGAVDAAVDGENWIAGSETKLRKATGSILSLYHKTELFWVALVLIDLVAQACKTAHSSDRFLEVIKNLELAFTFAFDVEIGIRIAGHFPDWRLFISSGRSIFDLFLAVACSVIQIPAIASSSIYPWLTAFQLLRWYRVILAFPRMKPLLITVFGSFTGLLNMILFLLLANLLGALAAVQLFRGDIPSGDTITMSQTYNAFLGMYQVFSSENWTDVLYLVMESEIPFKQQWLAAVFFCVWILFAFSIVLQMFIAVINENFAVAEEQKRKKQIEDFIRRSEPASAQVSWIDRLNPYRLIKAERGAVRVETLPPNLVLPMKQNIGPDVGVGPDIPSRREQLKSAKAAINHLFGRGQGSEEIPLRRLRRPRSAKFEDLDDHDDDRGLSDLLPPLNAGPSADEHLDAIREQRNRQADFIAAHPSYDESLWLFKQTNPLRRFCQACVSPAHGDRIFGRPVNPIFELILKTSIFCMVVASITVAAIATPEYRRQYYADRGISRDTWFDLAEVALGVAFILEAMMKIVADGFIFTPNAYLLSLWNVLDFLILITLLINTTTSLIYIGGLSRVTRALKAFRALRLITLFSRLRETLHAVLFAGAMKLLDASILMMLYLIPFAVWGLNIFSGRLFSCNDGDSDGINSCINEYFVSPIDDSLPYLVPRVWANPGLDGSVWAFDSFRESILILFEIVSLEGWIDVMESAMGIVGLGQQSETNASQWNAIFFVLFNLLGAVVILTLFLSVIIGNFSTRSGDALLTREQSHWRDLHKFIKAQTPSQLPKERPQFGLRAWCYDRSVKKHGYWTQAFTAIYCVHILLLMSEDFSSNILTDVQLDWIFLFLTLLYAVDLHIRLYGLGFKSFRANGWNLFDFVVITGSFATTIPALQAASHGLPGSQVNTQLQKLFLVAIPFKLVQRMSSLNQLFKTSVASLPAIGNLFLLWATLFIFFAMLMIEVFGLTKMGNNAETRFQNYYSFGNALVMLSFMSTGEGWNGYMHDYTISSPRCSVNSNYLESDCGSAAWAFGLFISWNIISMYIFCNMFTGVVVESFHYVYQMPGHASLSREDMRTFKKLWAEFDTERTGYIRRKDFVRFFSRLSGIWDIRMYPVEYSIPNILRQSIPDPVAKAAGRLLVVTGVKRAVDIRRVESHIRQIDYSQVRQRRQLFSRLYHEARITGEPGRGISFTSMLMMLAHYKLIDDEKALLLDDLLARREKTERVTDLVNLDRVRGLLRTIYWRRRFLASREERRRTLRAESNGIPAIVLDPTPITPPIEINPFSRQSERYQSTPSSPTSSASSREPSPSPGTTPGLTRQDTLHDTWGTPKHRPSLSQGGGPQRASVSRMPSNSSSMLSSEDAHYRSRESSVEDTRTEELPDAVESSVWGDMMQEAVDKEEA